MANRAGLRKVTKSVKGKKGTVQRSYWVKASGAVKGAAKSAGKFIGKHKGKIAAGAGLALGAAAAYKGAKFVKGYRGMGMSHGDAAKAVFGGLKDRAKGAAERGFVGGVVALRGVAAKAHKAVSTRMEQRAHRKAAASAEMPKSSSVRSAARSVVSKVKERLARRKQKTAAGALGSGS